MPVRKICGSSRKVGPIYNIGELRTLAKIKGLDDGTIQELSKQQLCKRLGVVWFQSYHKRPCNVRKSSIRPNAFTKPELRDEAVKKFGLTKTTANRYTKQQICDALNKNYDLPELTPRVRKPKYKPEPALESESEFVPEIESESESESSFESVSESEFVPESESESEFVPEIESESESESSFESVSESEFVPESESESSFESESEFVPESDFVSELEPIQPTCGNHITPFPHQLCVMRWFNTHRGLVVAHRVGTGKTLTAIMTAQNLISQNPKLQVIVSTPKSLRENFRLNGLTKFFGVVTDPQTGRPATPTTPAAQFALQCYQDALKHYTFYTHQGFSNAFRKTPQMCGQNVFLIIDEAHMLRTLIQHGKKTKGICADSHVRCAKTAGKVLILTATPVYNAPRDVANLTAMVHGEDPPTPTEFEQIMDNPEEFKKHFSCVFSFEQAPRTDYPKVIEKDVEIEMSPEYYRRYMGHEQDKIPIVSGSTSDPMKFLTGMRMATNLMTPCKKCEFAVNIIKNPLHRKQKVVLYSEYLGAGLNIIRKELRKNSITFTDITGKVSEKQRNERVQNFNNSPHPQVLLISKAGGAGLDLKNVRHVIMLESSWNRPIEDQVIGRAVRYRSHIGLHEADRTVTVWHLYLVKPETGRYPNDRMASADIHLKNIVDRKEQEAIGFLRDVTQLSIEELRSCEANC